ncbi:hypothetical protein HPB47_009698, partial [Ixodes persulcatus]
MTRARRFQLSVSKPRWWTVLGFTMGQGRQPGSVVPAQLQSRSARTVPRQLVSSPPTTCHVPSASSFTLSSHTLRPSRTGLRGTSDTRDFMDLREEFFHVEARWNRWTLVGAVGDLRIVLPTPALRRLAVQGYHSPSLAVEPPRDRHSPGRYGLGSPFPPVRLQTSLVDCFGVRHGLDLAQGDTLLDIGSGPILLAALLASSRFKHIVLSDLVEGNRLELNKWLDKSEDAIDWTHRAEQIAALEGYSAEKKPNESFLEFTYSLRAILVEWLKGVDAHGDHDKVVERICLEQLLRRLPEETRFWVQDKPDARTVHRAAELAEEFATRRALDGKGHPRKEKAFPPGKRERERKRPPREHTGTYTALRMTSLGVRSGVTLKTGNLAQGETLLDVGSGPILLAALLASSRFKHIVLSDLVEGSRLELNKWLDKSEDAIDWTHRAEQIAALEGYSDIKKGALEILERTRSAIRKVVSCDVLEPGVLPEEHRESFNVVMSAGCLDAATTDHESFRMALFNVGKLVENGGLLLLLGTCGLKSYPVEKSIEVCTFSCSGATVRALRERIDILPLKKLDCVEVYKSGNDLQNGGRGSAVVQDVMELLLRLRQQAQYVFCCKLMPQRRNKAADPELRYFKRALPRALKRNGDRN